MKECPHHQDYQSLRRFAELGCEACNDLLGLLPHNHPRFTTDAAAVMEKPCTVYSWTNYDSTYDSVHISFQYSLSWLRSAGLHLEI